LGIRCIPAVHRFIAERTIEHVEVEIDGKSRTMPIKIGRMQGKIYSLKAEFDHARDWASEIQIPGTGRDMCNRKSRLGICTEKRVPQGDQ